MPRLFPALEQGATFGRVAGMAAGQANNHSHPVTRRDHADLRVPCAARLADALRTVFIEPRRCQDAP